MTAVVLPLALAATSIAALLTAWGLYRQGESSLAVTALGIALLCSFYAVLATAWAVSR